MARPRNAKNKLNISKEAAKIKSNLNSVDDVATTTNENVELLKLGAGISLNTLIRAAAGDSSLDGISATNMISAADKLLSMYVKVLGQDAFALLDRVNTEEKVSEEITPMEEPANSNLSFLKQYTKK